MLKETDDEIYVPVSDRTLRKLDQLVQIFALAGEDYSEDRIIGMGLSNLLASLREHETFANENFPGGYSATCLTTDGEMVPVGP